MNENKKEPSTDGNKNEQNPKEKFASKEKFCVEDFASLNGPSPHCSTQTSLLFNIRFPKQKYIESELNLSDT